MATDTYRWDLVSDNVRSGTVIKPDSHEESIETLRVAFETWREEQKIPNEILEELKEREITDEEVTDQKAEHYKEDADAILTIWGENGNTKEA